MWCVEEEGDVGGEAADHGGDGEDEGGDEEVCCGEGLELEGQGPVGAEEED